MTISTKGRYGLRLLIDIALHQKEGVVNLKTIAERQGISVKYLWQVAHPLQAAGVLRVSRGAHGGFVLGKPPEEITLLDIVSILEGAPSLVECVGMKGCGKTGVCAAHVLWCQLSQTLERAMKAVTLRDAARLQKQLLAAEPSSAGQSRLQP